MVSLLEVGLSNACVAAAIAVVAWTFTQLSSNRHVAYLLWLLVLVKLVTPPLWTIPLPLAGPDIGTTVAWGDSSFSPLSTVESSPVDLTGSAAGESGSGAAGDTAMRDTPVTDWSLSHSWGWNIGIIISWAWLMSSVACVCIVMLRVWRFQGVIVGCGTASDAVTNRVEHFRQLLGLRRHVEVKILDENLPPMIWPLGRNPIMLLSRNLVEALSDSQRDSIIVHELAHLRRRDDVVTLLEAGVTCLFWWNPIVWLARVQLRAAAEDCCDAMVVRTLPGSRRQYGEALLRAAEPSAFKASLPILASTFGRQASLKRRIETILTYDYQGPPALFGKVCLIGLATFVLPFAATAMSPMDRESQLGLPPIDLQRDGASESLDRTQQDRPESSEVARATSNSPQAGRHFELWSMESNGQNARQIAYAPSFHIINSPEVSPDGRFVAVDGWKAKQSLRAAQLLVIDLETGDVEELGAGAMPNWSPDGNWIAYCKYSNEPGVFVRSRDGKTERHIDPRGWGIQWSPDGWKVAYIRGDRIVVLNLITALSREIVLAEWNYTRIYWNPTWSPDSKEICFKARNDQGHDEFAIVSVGKRVPTIRRRISAQGFNEDIAWHPDGTRILIPKSAAGGIHGQIYEFDPATDSEPTRLAGQPKDRHNSGMCWSRDGKNLFFISRK